MHREHKDYSPDQPLFSETENLLTENILRSEERVILSRSNGLSFKNDVIKALTVENALFLTSTGEQTDFAQMDQARRNPENMQMDSENISKNFRSGVTLSNIGVSAAVTVNINESDYLILVRRPNGMLMLPSGYVDSAKHAGYKRSAAQAVCGLHEINEEVLSARTGQNGLDFDLKTLIAPAIYNVLNEIAFISSDAVQPDEFTALQIELGEPYTETRGCYKLRHFSQQVSILNPANNLSVLPGLDYKQNIFLDNDFVDFGKFYYLKETKSGQFVYPYTLDLGDLSGLSLMHAETAPDKDGGKGDLVEILDRKGLILGKIREEDGLLSGETFYLSEGTLLPTGWNSADLIFSEVFSTQNLQINKMGLQIPVTTPTTDEDGRNITTAGYNEYLKSASENRKLKYE